MKVQIYHQHKIKIEHKKYGKNNRRTQTFTRQQKDQTHLKLDQIKTPIKNMPIPNSTKDMILKY